MMAAATVITFVAVVQRYLSTIPAIQELRDTDPDDLAGQHL
jgi:hypothetical protein